jgi:hypothetical protein
MQPQNPAFGVVPPGVGQPAYRAARRKPTRAEVPPPVINGVRLMYAGLAVTVLSFIFGLVDITRLDRVATKDPLTPVQLAAQSSVGILAVFAFIGSIIGFVMWPVCASAIRRGRLWGAVVGTVFFGLDTIGMLSVLVGVHGGAASKMFSVLVWVVGLVAIILAWNPQARAFYRAFR